MPKRKFSSGSAPSSKRSKRFSAYRRRSKMNAKTMVNIARREVLRRCETKYRQGGSENNALYHNFSDGAAAGNNINRITNLCQTVQGNSQSQRVGDEIYPVGVSLRFWISNKSDRPNCMYRIIVFTCPPDQVNSVTPSSFWGGASANKILDFVNTDKYKVIKQYIIKPMAGDYSLETGATNKEHSTMRKLWIPLRKTGSVKYQADNGDVAKYQKHNICVAIGAYDAFGSLASDNIASFGYSYRFYFKDP